MVLMTLFLDFASKRCDYCDWWTFCIQGIIDFYWLFFIDSFSLCIRKGSLCVHWADRLGLVMITLRTISNTVQYFCMFFLLLLHVALGGHSEVEWCTDCGIGHWTRYRDRVCILMRNCINMDSDNVDIRFGIWNRSDKLRFMSGRWPGRRAGLYGSAST